MSAERMFKLFILFLVSTIGVLLFLSIYNYKYINFKLSELYDLGYDFHSETLSTTKNETNQFVQRGTYSPKPFYLYKFGSLLNSDEWFCVFEDSGEIYFLNENIDSAICLDEYVKNIKYDNVLHVNKRRTEIHDNIEYTIFSIVSSGSYENEQLDLIRREHEISNKIYEEIWIDKKTDKIVKIIRDKTEFQNGAISSYEILTNNKENDYYLEFIEVVSYENIGKPSIEYRFE